MLCPLLDGVPLPLEISQTLVYDDIQENLPKKRSETMTCLEAEKMVNPYINNELSISELQDFMEHIENCENCREELEIYYMVDVGLKKLDEEQGTYDIVGDLKRHLEESRGVLRRFTAFEAWKYAVETLTAMALTVTVMLQVRLWIQAGFLFF